MLAIHGQYGRCLRKAVPIGQLARVPVGASDAFSRVVVSKSYLSSGNSAPNVNFRYEASIPTETEALQTDTRARLSKVWAPTGGIAAGGEEDGHSKLIRAGFLRQAHSGIFHMLPLGRRVQAKIERLVDRHMANLGASKVDLSSVSSQALWAESGRLNKIGSELFLFKDRKEAGYLLSPTHEEEITTLVGSTIKSYKELPVRLYQISRKYRDELRPRHGLLRSREFIMKDLYTFDINPSLALTTYDSVRQAYKAFFDELKVPYLVADADSGDMGGNLSHEYHFPTPVGEDNIISCSSCDYVANEELAEVSSRGRSNEVPQTELPFIDTKLVGDAKHRFGGFTVWRGITRDRATLVNVWYSLGSHNSLSKTRDPPEVNTHAVKHLVSGLDAGVEDAEAMWSQADIQASIQGSHQTLHIVNLVDSQMPSSVLESIQAGRQDLPIYPKGYDDSAVIKVSTVTRHPESNEPLQLLRIQEGDSCPKCDHGTLKVEKAIELGHTFYLGTRYSKPLNATVSIPSAQRDLLLPGNSEIDATSTATAGDAVVPMQMGCHGIGVSRMIGAVAETLSDEKGLNWPRVIAPYEVVILSATGNDLAAEEVYDELKKHTQGGTLDAVLDDRTHRFAWRMKDADLVGYPVIVVAGRLWKSERVCEVQCRRLGHKESIAFDQLADHVMKLLEQL